MKKFLKITLSLLLFVVTGYFIYKQHKKTAVLVNKIHVDAVSVLKVGIHDLKETLVLDVISSPTFYWDAVSFSDNKKEKDTIQKEGIGIDLTPYALVFYTMEGIKNTLFITIEVDDSELFQKYITNYIKEKGLKAHTLHTGYSYVTNSKSKMVFAWNKQKLAVAISTEINEEKYKSVFEDVLIKNTLITDKNHVYVKTLKNASDHIVYLSKENKVTINFRDGEAVLKGVFFTEKPQKYYSEVTYEATPNASLQLYFDANFENKHNRKEFIKNIEGNSFFKNNNIDVTSFANRTNGFLYMGIKGTTIQEDTIVTYTYNDNFDKIAQKTIQEKKVPKIVLNFGSEDESLKNYLKKQGVIKNNVLTAVPYYTFYTKEDVMKTSFETEKKNQKTQKRLSNSFFNLEVDFSSLKNDIEIPQTKDFFSLVNKLSVVANQLEKNKVDLKGKLTTTNKKVNVLSHLFFGIRKKYSLK